MWWGLSHRADKRAVPLADRHYNRQKIGAPQFVPPGRCMVLRHGDDSLWVTSFPIAEYVQHAWAGAWMNSLFRNESDRLSSEAIREAVAITRTYTMETASWNGETPELGMVSFIDAKKTKPKDKPGWCYRKAGFHHVGFTKRGLWVMQILPSEMPDPLPVPLFADGLGSVA